MISKNMYKVLKNIPHAPYSTDYEELCNNNILNKSILLNLLEEAFIHKYIDSIVSSPKNIYSVISYGFYLTEAGQVEIEEYKNQKGSSAKATWAIIISILSLIVSAIAIILKI